ncbi:uncharacterized protein B0H18DRAFT_836473, partial [Fomitopsis serialis]|uniref:uncharacterized protein n=1 Tax=Fomitopsis serialis TaxID=139415 RepID=UPI002008901C
FTQDADFWYEDGNIIIVAQEVGFRVYKGFIASRSEVFRDMISLAQPVLDSSCEGTLDGCPYVHVSDTAAEIRSLLRILFIGRQYVFKPYMRRTDLEFDDMANCIRLAHKYDIPDLLEDALEKLEGYYPESDPDSWDTVCGDGPSTRAIVALNLAHLTDTPSIFPAAMYDCCNLDGQTILAGRIHSDGAADFLSPVDLARCIDGKARLCSRNSQVIREVL